MRKEWILSLIVDYDFKIAKQAKKSKTENVPLYLKFLSMNNIMNEIVPSIRWIRLRAEAKHYECHASRTLRPTAAKSSIAMYCPLVSARDPTMRVRLWLTIRSNSFNFLSWKDKDERWPHRIHWFGPSLQPNLAVFARFAPFSHACPASKRRPKCFSSLMANAKRKLCFCWWDR